jgi:ammonia channel protein AmtB
LKFKNGDWTIDRVHEFVKLYNCKLDNQKMGGFNPSMTVLGTLLLWVGWTLFNAGSTGAIIGQNGEASYKIAERAMINTILAPTTGGLFT